MNLHEYQAKAILARYGVPVPLGEVAETAEAAEAAARKIGALVVPTSAVRQSAEDGRPFVYRIAGRALDVAEVQLGVVDDRGGVAEVLSGLAEGDRVIVGNIGTLGRGMQIIVAGEERQQGPANARQ